MNLQSRSKGKPRTGWHWTRHGWERKARKPRRAAPVPAKKRRHRKPVVVKAAPEREARFMSWRAPQIAQEWLLEPLATHPAAEPRKRAYRPLRAAWAGKYDALHSTPPKRAEPTP